MKQNVGKSGRQLQIATADPIILPELLKDGDRVFVRGEAGLWNKATVKRAFIPTYTTQINILGEFLEVSTGHSVGIVYDALYNNYEITFGWLGENGLSGKIAFADIELFDRRCKEYVTKCIEEKKQPITTSDMLRRHLSQQNLVKSNRDAIQLKLGDIVTVTTKLDNWHSSNKATVLFISAARTTSWKDYPIATILSDGLFEDIKAITVPVRLLKKVE